MNPNDPLFGKNEPISKPRPKITAVIPVYNQEAYIKDCLESLLLQTLPEWEAVCIDDGSTDASGDILEQYARTDERIKVIHQENHGAGNARNRGITKASGEYIAFLDPDDCLPAENTLSRLYNAAREHDVSICGGSLEIFREDRHKTTRQFDGIYQKYSFREDSLIDYRDYQFDMGFTRFIYRKDLLLKNNITFPEYKAYEDPPFFVNAMAKAGKFYAIKDITYCYRNGHKPAVISEDKVYDLIRGLTDVLFISAREDLKELHLLTLTRLVYDYRSWLGQGFDKNAEKTMQLLSEAQKAVRPEWLAGAGYKTVFGTQDDALEKIYNSASWKIGNMLIQPFHLLKQLIKKFLQ